LSHIVLKIAPNEQDMTHVGKNQGVDGSGDEVVLLAEGGRVRMRNQPTGIQMALVDGAGATVRNLTALEVRRVVAAFTRLLGAPVAAPCSKCGGDRNWYCPDCLEMMKDAESEARRG
jgi:hypothetical protein